MSGDDDDDLGEKIAAFLASDPIGVAGASQDPSKYGHRVLAALLESGRRAIPVHPKEKEILGAATVAAVGDLPRGTRALSLITPPPVTERIVADALARGFDRFWMQPGAESPAAIAAAEAAGAAVIAGGPCILVSLSQERGRRAAGGGAGGSRRG
jgi:predicted CoA-binding protein